MSSIIPESVPPEYPLLYFLLDYKQREEDKEFVDLLMAVQDASLHKPDQIAQLRWREDLMVSHDEMNSRHFFEFPSQDLDYETWQSNSLVTLWCGDSLLYGRRNKVEKEEEKIEDKDKSSEVPPVGLIELVTLDKFSLFIQPIFFSSSLQHLWMYF